ncbi:MAG TPA: hypothetical protein IAA98_11540 [Candidatus Avipropionibacterium avicola]|uniref:Uncharacterized protein n=1 Tax=Candidatus Avipropionibacterium avicola TaxID=2840701 RepID=A0A9D1GYK5_9ACTN|nr:hypothetical protein [Candidatus Avipropionibacterium avicola]
MGTEDVILLVASLVLAAGSVGIGVAVRSRRHHPAPLVTGIGVAAVLVGGWLSGLTALLWHGILGLVSWAVAVPTEVISLVGAILLGLGIVTMVVGGVAARRHRPSISSGTALPPSTSKRSKRKDRKERKAKQGSEPAEDKPRGISPAGSGVARVPGMTDRPATTTQPTPEPVRKQSSPDPSPLEISEPPRTENSSPTASGNLPPTIP